MFSVAILISFNPVLQAGEPPLFSATHPPPPLPFRPKTALVRWQAVVAHTNLRSSRVPRVGWSGSSNDLSSESMRASLISDLKKKRWQEGENRKVMNRRMKGLSDKQAKVTPRYELMDEGVSRQTS